jgi:hypothetical protein
MFKEREGRNNMIENWSLENEGSWEKHKKWRDKILGKGLTNFDGKMSIRRTGGMKSDGIEQKHYYIGSTKNNA